MCKLTTPCPYDHQCEDCLHHAPGGQRGKKNQKTGISTNDMREYSREYKRRKREEQLQLEMEHAGVVS